MVDLRERRLPRRGAGAHEQMVVLDPLRAALGRRDQHAVALDGALAVDDRGLDQVEPLAHAARLVLPDEAGVRLGAQQVDARPAVLEDEAARLGAIDLGHRRGDLEQRLRRDAVRHRPVAAERHAVDDRDLGAERGGGRGGGVSGRAGSEDQEAHLLTARQSSQLPVRSGRGRGSWVRSGCGAAPRRASQRQSAQRGLRRLRAAAARRRTPGPPGGVGGFTRGSPPPPLSSSWPAAVELALLPGLVLGAHDPEDEVEQPDQRDLEPEEQPQEPQIRDSRDMQGTARAHGAPAQLRATCYAGELRGHRPARDRALDAAPRGLPGLRERDAAAQRDRGRRRGEEALGTRGPGRHSASASRSRSA